MTTTTAMAGPAPSAAGLSQDGQPQLSVLGAIHQGFLVREPECAALAGTQPRRSPRSTSRSMSASDSSRQTDYEVSLKLEGKAEAAGHRAVRVRPDLRRRLPHPERAAGALAAAGHDRMPAAVVSVRARDRRARRCATAASRRCCSIRSISSRSISSAWRRRRHSAASPATGCRA